MSNTTTTALIVDDEPIMRTLARLTIEASLPGLSVAGESSSGEDAVNDWRRLRPSVVLMDQRMTGIDGLEAARMILAEDPTQRIILFSAILDEPLKQRARQLGVFEFLSKSDIHLLPDVLARRTTG